MGLVAALMPTPQDRRKRAAERLARHRNGEDVYAEAEPGQGRPAKPAKPVDVAKRTAWIGVGFFALALFVHGCIVNQERVRFEAAKLLREGPPVPMTPAEQREAAEELANMGPVMGTRWAESNEIEALFDCERRLRNQLKDPDSYREVSHAVNIDTVIVRYTATNSFNARITSMAVCKFGSQGELAVFESV